MNETLHSILIVAVVALVTLLTRALAFLVFRGKTPRAVLYLGRVLPFAIMGMLVVYCLKNTNFAAAPHGLAEVTAVMLVVIVHKWRHSTLLSIMTGTLFYMLMVQLIVPLIV